MLGFDEISKYGHNDPIDNLINNDYIGFGRIRYNGNILIFFFKRMAMRIVIERCVSMGLYM